MSNWKTEAEAREQIKAIVAEYYHDFKEKKEPFKPGDRISYASRVFDEKEMQSLTDAMLDFWLTTGRFSDEFEKKFAEWIGVKYAHLVNSGPSVRRARPEGSVYRRFSGFREKHDKAGARFRGGASDHGRHRTP